MEMDEAVAEKVNQMTKLVMTSTVDAWLIYLPGMIRRHEVFTTEQLLQHMSNLYDLVSSMQDPQDNGPGGGETHTLSLC
jgi:hypothetical protein